MSPLWIERVPWLLSTTLITCKGRLDLQSSIGYIPASICAWYEIWSWHKGNGLGRHV